MPKANFPCPMLALTAEKWPLAPKQEPFREHLARSSPRGSCRFAVRTATHQTFSQTRMIAHRSLLPPLAEDLEGVTMAWVALLTGYVRLALAEAAQGKGLEQQVMPAREGGEHGLEVVPLLLKHAMVDASSAAKVKAHVEEYLIGPEHVASDKAGYDMVFGRDAEAVTTSQVDLAVPSQAARGGIPG